MYIIRSQYQASVELMYNFFSLSMSFERLKSGSERQFMPLQQSFPR